RSQAPAWERTARSSASSSLTDAKQSFATCVPKQSLGTRRANYPQVLRGSFQSVLRVRLQIPRDSIGASDGVREEGDGFSQPIVRLCTAEAQKSLTGGSEAFAAEARDAELIVRSFQEVHCQAVGLDTELAANRRHIGKDVECTGRHQHIHPF